VMTPKSLLRLAAARSAAEDFTRGSFGEVLDDPAPPAHAERLIFTQGKMYHDLATARDERKAPVAIVRIEQLYPFPAVAIRRILDGYPGTGQPVWVQEEPANMGAWRFLQAAFKDHLGIDVAAVTREESASPATGSLKVHSREQAALVDQALAGLGA